MVEVILLTLLCAVAAVCYGVLGRDREAVGFWVAALAASIGTGVCSFVVDDVRGAEAVGSALGGTYPVLLFAGALAYTRRRVPWWLIPAAFALGGSRSVVPSEIQPLVRGIELSIQVGVMVAAGVLVHRSAEVDTPTRVQRALPVLLVFDACVFARINDQVQTHDAKPLRVL